MSRRGAGPPLRAVCVDLDDTLFPQEEWLAGAWRAVAARAAREGIDEARMHRALVAIASGGSDRGRIIDRALQEVGAAETPTTPLLEEFRAHRPPSMAPYPGARTALSSLADLVPVALVSDGDPHIQQAKLDALDLAHLIDVIVWSDELGRAHRKPAPLPFRTALARLGCAPEEVVFVGDRPDKDIAGALAVGMRAVRVQTGEHRAQPDVPGTWAVVDTFAAACAFLVPRLGGPQTSSTSTSARNSSSPGASR